MGATLTYLSDYDDTGKWNPRFISTPDSDIWAFGLIVSVEHQPQDTKSTMKGLTNALQGHTVERGREGQRIFR